MNITGAIFDFDGTVFDSMHIWKGVKFQFFDRIGLVLNEEQREEFKKLFLLDAIELAKTRFDLKMTDKENSWDKLLQIKTVGRDDTNSDEYRYPYEPTPYSVLERLAATDLFGKDDVVLDYRCGKGRGYVCTPPDQRPNGAADGFWPRPQQYR